MVYGAAYCPISKLGDLKKKGVAGRFFFFFKYSGLSCVSLNQC